MDILIAGLLVMFIGVIFIFFGLIMESSFVFFASFIAFLCGIVISLFGACHYSMIDVSLKNIEKPAPISWFKKLPKSELKIMHHYIEKTGKPLTKYRFNQLKNHFKKHEIENDTKKSNDKNLKSFESQLKATS